MAAKKAAAKAAKKKTVATAKRPSGKKPVATAKRPAGKKTPLPNKSAKSVKPSAKKGKTPVTARKPPPKRGKTPVPRIPAAPHSDQKLRPTSRSTPTPSRVQRLPPS